MLSDIKCQGCFNMQNNCIQSLTNSGCMWKLSNCLVEVKLDLPRDAHSGEREIKRLR
ncbi:hypothetical protein C5167_032833 [Papaver somniferum]|uniref:Uncharacterized protein n=1 Tax=Papaver somniferum TaxID=3469 RepID=A0A4Y7K8M5_PAPSO|nr:hypothetical protein C5167_032833 [Papaver somniferum]